MINLPEFNKMVKIMSKMLKHRYARVVFVSLDWGESQKLLRWVLRRQKWTINIGSFTIKAKIFKYCQFLLYNRQRTMTLLSTISPFIFIGTGNCRLYSANSFALYLLNLHEELIPLFLAICNTRTLKLSNPISKQVTILTLIARLGAYRQMQLL